MKNKKDLPILLGTTGNKMAYILFKINDVTNVTWENITITEVQKIADKVAKLARELNNVSPNGVSAQTMNNILRYTPPTKNK